MSDEISYRRVFPGWELRQNGLLRLVFDEIIGIEKVVAVKFYKDRDKWLGNMVDSAVKDLMDPSVLSDSDCAICRESMSEIIPIGGQRSLHRAVKVICGHVFGYSCLRSWLFESEVTTCPMCRGTLIAKLNDDDISRPILIKAFQKLKANSNNWSIGHLKRRMKDTMYTNMWIKELVEIFAALLWNIDEDDYWRKAMAVISVLVSRPPSRKNASRRRFT